MFTGWWKLPGSMQAVDASHDGRCQLLSVQEVISVGICFRCQVSEVLCILELIYVVLSTLFVDMLSRVRSGVSWT